MQLTLVSLHVEEEHQRSKHFPTFADRRLKKTHKAQTCPDRATPCRKSLFNQVFHVNLYSERGKHTTGTIITHPSPNSNGIGFLDMRRTPPTTHHDARTACKDAN